jgi:hypothetical protein
MVKTLLVRGMIAGAVAGLLAFGFARVFGEPQIDKAIAFEEMMEKAEQAAHDHGNAATSMPAGHDHGNAAAMSTAKPEAEEPELVSRGVQASIGLFTAVAVYGAGIGGLFALVFAFAYGRIGQVGARTTAALLAAAGFFSVVVVPFLKYPANPPAIGNPETIGIRTALFLIMIAISIAALTLAISLGKRLVARFGGWNAAIIAGAAFVVIIAAAQLILPAVNEVPEQFSADVLWRFRMASLGMHVVMWTTLGLLFGGLTARILDQRTGATR